MLQYRVKFCGGCNPKYNRRYFFERLEKEFNNSINFTLLDENVLYDGLVLICGCERSCTNYDNIRSKTKEIIITSSDQLEETIKIIKERQTCLNLF